MFKSEYLICCGSIDVIICERRDMELKLIKSFNLTLTGNIKNLTLENHNDIYIELLYYNDTLNNIYEYHIYPPKCKIIDILSNSIKSSYIVIDKLLETNTNNNYYISLDTNTSDNLKININNNSINTTNEKIKLEQSDNKLYYEFKNQRKKKKN